MTDASRRKFYHLSIEERVARLDEEVSFEPDERAALGCSDAFPLELADQLVENVVGLLALPLGVARNFVVDGRAVTLPMATEEPSVIAAASHGAKLLAKGGGIATEVTEPCMVGQVFVLEVRGFEEGVRRLTAEREAILAHANEGHPNLVAAGGGARGFEVRTLDARPEGWIVAFELIVDVRDAMGANTINSMCERIAPRVADLLGGRVGMRILTNLCDRRVARAEGRVPEAALGSADGALAVREASLFAELDPHRACTHNKGIMNGIDALLIACGQDWRAVEAGAHAYAARDGKYAPLAVWSVDAEGDLRGRIELPVAVGTVGARLRLHPVVRAALRIAGVERASDLARLCAAVGLAQNLAAIRALAHEGIQQGHMALHHRVSEAAR